MKSNSKNVSKSMLQLLQPSNNIHPLVYFALDCVCLFEIEVSVLVFQHQSFVLISTLMLVLVIEVFDPLVIQRVSLVHLFTCDGVTV